MSSNSIPDRAILTRWLQHRRVVLTILTLLALAMLPGLLQLETDNSPQVFFVEDSEGVRKYQEHRRVFGSDVTLRLVIEGPQLWSSESLVWMAEIEQRVAELPGVLQVSGLYSHHRRFGWPPENIESFRAAAINNSLDRGAGWISAGGNLVTLLIQIESLSSEENTDLLDSLNRMIDDPPQGIVCRALGLPVLNRELDVSSKEIETVFFPLLILFTVLLLGWVLRRISELVATLLFVGLCQLIVMAFMGYVGARLNMVLAILPPLLFAIALASAVHIVLYLRRASSTEPADDEPRELRVTRVFQDKGWALLWTGVTTVIGFASLTISPLSPVRSLGVWAAIGLALTTFCAFVFFPPILATLGFGTASATGSWEARWARRGKSIGRWAHSHRGAVLLSAGLISGVALLGVPHIQTASNALHYLAPDHPLRSGIERLESHDIGVAAVELVIQMPANTGGAPPAFTSAIEVDRLADLGTELEQLDGVFGVVSAGSVLRDALRHVPTTPTNVHMRQQMALQGLQGDVEGRRVLNALLTQDRLTAHATVFVKTSDIEHLNHLDQRITELSLGHFPEATLETTGQYPLLLEAQKYLISTLISSLGLTLLVIAFVLRLVLPSYRLALLALLPNLWPIVGVFGYMGWFGVPLDIASVMTASVVLGLAVDDSIHTLGHFRRLAPALGSRAAVEETLFATAPAYVLTACILIAGFGVCALSTFAPIARFGGLSAVAIGLALVGDLILLPALLSLTPKEVTDRLA